MAEKQSATVLVVEDENPLSDIIKHKFEKFGIDVVTAQGGEQTFEQLKNNTDIAAIWLDHYLLGHENGLDLLRQLKDVSSEWRDIPVFVVSNTATADKINAYLELGINHYYTKSDHRLDEIVEEVCKTLGR